MNSPLVIISLSSLVSQLGMNRCGLLYFLEVIKIFLSSGTEQSFVVGILKGYHCIFSCSFFVMKFGFLPVFHAAIFLKAAVFGGVFIFIYKHFLYCHLPSCRNICPCMYTAYGFPLGLILDSLSFWKAGSGFTWVNFCHLMTAHQTAVFLQLVYQVWVPQDLIPFPVSWKELTGIHKLFLWNLGLVFSWLLSRSYQLFWIGLTKYFRTYVDVVYSPCVG